VKPHGVLEPEVVVNISATLCTEVSGEPIVGDLSEQRHGSRAAGGDRDVQEVTGRNEGTAPDTKISPTELTENVVAVQSPGPTKRRRQPKPLPIKIVTRQEVEALQRAAKARVQQRVRPTWDDDALCHYLDPRRLDELFFPNRRSEDIYKETGKICMACAAKDPCLKRALETKDPGFWAGTTAAERDMMED